MGFTYNPFGKGLFQFYAEAIGPLGNYLAAASDEFKAPYTMEWPNWFPPNMNTPPTKDALDDVLTQLLSDGWEPYGKGEWGLPKFRRQVA